MMQMWKKRVLCLVTAGAGVWALTGAAAPAEAKWIWGELPVQKEVKSSSFFRLTLHLPDDPVAGDCYLMVDDGCAVYVNGREIKPVYWVQPARRIMIQRFDMKPLLVKGKNVLAIIVVNTGGPGGLIARGSVRLANGKKMEFVSSPEWRTVMTEIKGWRDVNFDDGAWGKAKVQGGPGLAPWAGMSDAENFFGAKTR